MKNTMLGTDFFQRDVLTVARELIGVELVWHGCSGVIVETEAYAVEGDEACHTVHRPSAREFVRTMPAGAAYVYLNYGMYWLFNLLVKGGGQDGLILVRALEPRRGMELMMERRRTDKATALCSGPGKLALALGITGAHHGTIMAGRVRPGEVGLRNCVPAREVTADVRVGISKAKEYQWRFLSKGSAHLSVPHGAVKACASGARSKKAR
jgi:DNA-3-methyladenine glycosylase